MCIRDSIEAASWANLACVSDGRMLVRGIRPETLGNFLSYFREVGGGYRFVDASSIEFFRERKLSAIDIKTDVYPGFSTDLQQPFAILLTQAEGVSTIHETVYEQRLGYLEVLNLLGANCEVSTECPSHDKCRFDNKSYPHFAKITGSSQLTAVSHPIEVPDLRAGLCYLIAAAVAEGDSYLTNVEFIERGYGNLVPRLAALNLRISNVVLEENLLIAK